MWKWLRRVLVELAMGAFLGFASWTVVGSSLTSLLFGSLGGSFSCRADVELALQRYTSWQLYSAIAGGVMVAAGSTLMRRWLARRKAANGSAASIAEVPPPEPPSAEPS